MKIKVFTHLSLKTIIADDFLKVVAYYSSPFVKQYINETIEFSIEPTGLNYEDEILFNKPDFHDYMFIFEQGTFPVYAQTRNYANKRVSYISVNPLEDNIDYTWKVIAHELLHAICYRIMAEKKVFIPNLLDQSLPTPYFHNDDPYFVGGNFEQQLKVLKQFYSIYQYFSTAEVAKWKLKPELWQILDDSRALSGTPFIITSGLRTIEQNKVVGGTPNSAHLRGLAADIACTDPLKRTTMLRGILGCGRPVFLEIAKAHLHVDIDASIHRLGDTIISEGD